MKVLLVRPSLNKKTTTVRNFMFGEPIGIECVSTILKELKHNVLLVDLLVEKERKFIKYLKDFKPDVVGFTSQCTDIDNILYLAGKVKDFDKNIKVIVGGIQATISPEAYFNKNVDYIFKSTTRDNYKKLMEQIKNGTNEEIEGIYSRRRQYQVTLPSCQNEYIKPDRESTKKYRKHYKYVGFSPCAVLQTSWGCRNHCKFCVRWRIEGAKVTELPINEVVDDIKKIEEPYIMIIDNDFLISEKRLVKFLDLIEKKKIKKKYIVYGSVNSILEKEHLFKRFAKNGLKAVIVGYESFDDKQLKKWNKAATVDENYKATQILKKNGIAVWGSFILHPDFTKEDFKKLIKYNKKLSPELLTFSPLVPHPLTPLYKEYKDRLIYDVEDYEKWNFGDVLIYPSNMSLRSYYWEILKFGIPVNLRWYSIKYMLREFPLKNTFRMAFGFNQSIKVYLKNILKRGN